jgi:hypothetical protein
MPHIIGANSLQMFKTWVYAAYDVYDDMKSHMGGIMSFSTGVIDTKSCKQHLNVKSSTKAKVVGASNYLPWVISVALTIVSTFCTTTTRICWVCH